MNTKNNIVKIRVKNITIDDLGRMINNGFKEADKNLMDVKKELKQEINLLEAKMDRRFNEVDKRFEDVYRRFDDIDKRFGDVYRRFDDIDKRFDNVDKRFNTIDIQLDDIKIKLCEHDSFKPRLTRIEKKVGIPTFS